MRTASRFRLLMFAVALSWSGPALAQGLFESLFGGGQSQRHTAPAPGPRQSLPPPVQPAFGYRTPTYNPFRTPGPREADDQSAQQSRSGSYRTMCVRMCDGFYWPISHNVARSSFYRDANACRASCGEDAKLFFHAAPDF